MPPDQSADGHRLDALLHLTLGVTAALGVAFVVALGVVVYRARMRERTRTPAAPASTAFAVTGGLAVAVLVFAVVDLTLASRSHRDTAGPPPSDALRVEVLAQQWAWRFRYAGPDGRFGTDDDVTTLNELRVPAGRAVALQVRSLDVVHGLFLPTLRARADAYPGRTTRTWFRAARAGAGEVACSVLCGAGHYQMRGEVTVLPSDDYDRWMSGLIEDQRRVTAAGGTAPRGGWEWLP